MICAGKRKFEYNNLSEIAFDEENRSLNGDNKSIYSNYMQIKFVSLLTKKVL